MLRVGPSAARWRCPAVSKGGRIQHVGHLLSSFRDLQQAAQQPVYNADPSCIEWIKSKLEILHPASEASPARNGIDDPREWFATIWDAARDGQVVSQFLLNVKVITWVHSHVGDGDGRSV